MRKLVEIAKKIRWRKIGRWRTPFLMECMVTESTTKERLKRMGFDIWFHNFLHINGENYITQEDYDTYSGYYQDKLKKEGIGYFKRYSELIKRKGDESIGFSLQVKKRRLDKIPLRELKRLFRQFLRRVEPNMGRGYTIQMVDEALTDALKEKLRNYSENEADLLFARLTYPKEEAFMVKENRELIRIAMADAGKRQKMLARHKEKYGWMNTLNWNEPFYELDYYMDRLQKIKNPQEKLKELDKKRRDTEKEIASLISRIEGKGIKIRGYVDSIRILINIKMFNWDSISISGSNCRNLITRIGEAAGLDYYDTIELSPDEIEGILDKKEVPKKKIEERRRCSGSLRLEKEFYELNEEQVKEIREFIHKIPEDVGQLKGQVVYPGKVKGKVVVIMHSGEISKMKKESILVCPMTNPDYMPAIHKAKAIVTDEGGILCHAAIVSREFQIPCITGTKIATKVIKDGDMIEVDATKGIVRKIKKCQNNQK